MIEINSARGTGKTSQAIIIAKEYDAIIVCADPEYVVNKMYRLGVTGIPVAGYDYLLRYEYRTMNQPIVIDELDPVMTTDFPERDLCKNADGTPDIELTLNMLYPGSDIIAYTRTIQDWQGKEGR